MHKRNCNEPMSERTKADLHKDEEKLMAQIGLEAMKEVMGEERIADIMQNEFAEAVVKNMESGKFGELPDIEAIMFQKGLSAFLVKTRNGKTMPIEDDLQYLFDISRVVYSFFLYLRATGRLNNDEIDSIFGSKAGFKVQGLAQIVIDKKFVASPEALAAESKEPGKLLAVAIQMLAKELA